MRIKWVVVVYRVGECGLFCARSEKLKMHRLCKTDDYLGRFHVNSRIPIPG